VAVVWPFPFLGDGVEEGCCGFPVFFSLLWEVALFVEFLGFGEIFVEEF